MGKVLTGTGDAMAMMDRMAGVGKEGIVMMEVPSVRLSTKEVVLGKVRVKLYSIGHLALATHRSTATIRRWQRLKIVPPPIVKTNDGARWYLKEEVELFKRLLQQYEVRNGSSIEKTGFPTAILAESQALRRKLESNSRTGA